MMWSDEAAGPMNLRVRMPPLLAALAFAAFGQQRGDAPPALVWDSLKGACPPSLDWTSLRGNVVTISFGDDDVSPEDVTEWAAAQRKFQGQPAVFLQVVAGSEFLLDRALSKTAYTGCILLDSHQANRKNYNLPRFLPRTVVVDRLGVIAGYSRGGPDETGIRSVLNGETETSLSKKSPQPTYYDPNADADPIPSYEVHISPAAKNERRSLGEARPADIYITKNQPLKAIFMDLWDVPMYRISLPDNLDAGNYDVIAHIPIADRDLLRKTVQDAIERRFGLQIEKETRIGRVYLQTAGETLPPQLQPAGPGDKWTGGGGQGSIIGTAHTMREIAGMLQDLLGAPVLDETGVQGKYNYSVSSELPLPDAAFEYARQLGLRLTPADRPIEMLIVRKVGE